MVLLGSVTRGGRRLSHEVGHIVGFHHTAGMGLDFKYSYNVCDPPVEWVVMQQPTCEVNIMGGWYDGPMCCPGSQPTAEKQCEVGHIGRYCCGDECTHSCPKEAPPMTFATAEHKGIMRSILTCWLSFVGAELSASESQHVYSFAHTSRSELTYTEDYAEASAADRWRIAAAAANTTSPTASANATSSLRRGGASTGRATATSARAVSARRLQAATEPAEDGIVFL